MREPINTITHLIGVLLGFLALGIMVTQAILKHNPYFLASGFIFGMSIILLYSASTIYHWYNGKKDNILVKLRKLDHSMIFVLIAGTYTPICLTVLRGTLGYVLLALVWSLAIFGTISKVIFINMPRWLSAGMYLFLGWLSIFFIVPIFRALPFAGFLWLVIGGILYTVGSVFYAKKPKFSISGFGFHEIFHLFILAGSLAHFILINQYIFGMNS
ncbi:MAG: hemolysin [Clostridiales bacterium 38-18]|nr:MAG: hemolysin [Clostridiales bacterium 38-18]